MKLYKLFHLKYLTGNIFDPEDIVCSIIEEGYEHIADIRAERAEDVILLSQNTTVNWGCLNIDLISIINIPSRSTQKGDLIFDSVSHTVQYVSDQGVLTKLQLDNTIDYFFKTI